MNKDMAILIIMWLIMAGALVLFVPRDKIRRACLIFLFKQSITWLVGLIVVENRLIEYPVRMFAYANRTSFTFEYFIFPSICVLFNLYYPEKKGHLGQFMHYVYYCTAMTIVEVLCQSYTNLIRYTHWSWYMTWITEFATFFISRRFYTWFFKLKKGF